MPTDDFFPDQTTAQGTEAVRIDDNDDPSTAPRPKGGKLTFKLPKKLTGVGGEAVRAELGSEIVNMIYQDEWAASAMDQLADQIDDLYYGRESESLTALWEDAPSYNAKTLGNKLKQLVAFVAGPMTGLDPYFVLRLGGPKGKKAVQSQGILHYFLNKAKYELALDEACGLVARRGRCPVQVTYEGRRKGIDKRIKKGRIVLRPIDLRYVRIYPNSAANAQEARLFGYIRQERVREIDEAQRAGKYTHDTKIRAGILQLQTPGYVQTPLQTTSTNAVYREDDPVDIFEGVLKKDLDGDGFEELYYVTVAKYQRVLLRIEPFQLDMSWFADLFFERETGRYRPENSVGRDMIGAHDLRNDSLNLFIQGLMMKISPAAYTDSWAMDDEVVESKPGQLRGIEGAGKIVSIGGAGIDVGDFPKVYEMSTDIADECAKVSQNGLGSNQGTGAPVSATEASQIANGQNTGIRGYSSKIAHGAVEIAQITLELLWRNFDDWAFDYQDTLDLEGVNAKTLQADYWITVNGQTPIDAPAAQIQQVGALTQFLTTAVQLDPSILQKAPDIVMNLLRSFIDSTDLANKETILPTEQEVEKITAMLKQQQAQQQLAAQLQNANQNIQPGQSPQPAANGGVPQQPGMGLSAQLLGGQAGGVPQGTPAPPV